VTRWDDLVVLVGEANAWPYSSAANGPAGPSSSTSCSTARDGETFARVIAPRRPLSPTAAHHTASPRRRLRRRSTGPTWLADSRVRAPTDLIAAWGHYGRRWSSTSAVRGEPCLDLRAAGLPVHNTKIGTLDEYARSFGPVPRP